ncbi:PAS domain S-box protein [Pontibacter sp. E15-1]|uniref:PAS domain S-box protein n=1 Tax=Pontibacter sp. E15-1 TaxID=2919918 RepID=UPI001F4FB70F|nr:PAS domain S-box protein [Pontibacter sp. E15-1]MCJ8166716.1 PAS domain S-box protein [Pontibacter sp. E15-1]
MQHSNHDKTRYTTFERTARYIGFAFAGLTFVLLVVCVSSLSVARKMQQKYDYEVLQALSQLEMVNFLLHNQDDVQNLLLAHIDTSDASEKQRLHKKIKREHNRNTSVINRLERTTGSPLERDLLRDVVAERVVYYKLADSLVSLSNQHRMEEAEAFAQGYLYPSYERHERRLIKFSELVNAAAGRKVQVAFTGINSSVNTQIFLLILAMVAAVGGAIIIHWVLKWLRQENMLLSVEITERIKLEEELQQQRREYKMLFNRNPLPMWVYDKETLRFLEVNKAAVAEYGYTEAEFLQMTLLDIRPESEQARLKKQLQRSESLAILNSNGYLHRRKNGAVFKVEIKSHSLPRKQEANPRLVVAVNVQKREDALEKLKKNEMLLREVSSSVPGAVFQYQMEADGKVSFNYISEGVQELCGVAPKDVYRDPRLLYKNVYPADMVELQRATQESSRKLIPWEQEIRVWHPTLKKYIWVRGHSLPTAKENGVVFWNGTFINISTQKDAQEQLKRNEADLRALLDSSLQSIFLLDENLNVLSFNKEAAADVHRHLLKELKAGQSLKEFMAPSQLPDIVENHAKAMRGETVMYEIGQGDYWHEITYQPVVSPEHTTLGVALNIRDISEQKKNFEIIRQKELQLARAQQLAKLGSWEYNLAQDVLTWSDSTFAIYGLKKGKFIPTRHNMFSCIHPEDRVKVQQAHQRTIDSKQLLNLEYRILLDGEKEAHLYEVAEAVCDKKGRVIKLYGTVQDITERKKAEQEIKDARNLLQSTIENIPEIIFTANADFNILYISPQCAQITGYAEAFYLGKAADWLNVIHQEDKKPLLQHIVPRVLQGMTQEFEMRMLDSDGRLRWLLLRLSPGKNHLGEVVRIYGSASDMTAYKETEARQLVLSQQLQKQNQNLQQFAYIVSHNLRAPIANMLGLTSIYNRNDLGSPINQKVIDNMIKSARLLDTTIRDLNDILTIRSQIGNSDELVSLECLFQDVQELLKGEIDTYEVCITQDFSEAPTLRTVRSYAHSILLNLISNAVKYKCPSRKLVIKVTTFRVNDYICLRVQDNGSGIDLEKQRNNIFGLYKRFHKGIEGKGIGLHLVKTQVEMLEGKVEVESKPNEGTVFNVYFKN